ncbi:DUF262 domain-containing protein [Gillisia hiemivivida]|uniref:DUF262 domain-containing protein n=1 Tax=Gillisia hiemivivida TaxID=291190 RepID=UPI0014796EE1|nr:DUF262 domain-containing protein [Gillisia hiemivivida]
MQEELTLNNIENVSVKVVSCTLRELLNCNSDAIPGTSIVGQLHIPEYQRPYVWKEKQINQLLNDYIEYDKKNVADKPLYYLGSILLHHDDGKLNIIDGQQRITTALLIQKLKNEEIKSGLEYSSSSTIKNIKKNLKYLKSIQDKNIFEFREFDVFDLIKFDEINITLIITSTQDLAYTFFETQNTGGVRLEGSDILKAHHLRAIDCKKTVNYQARKWESIDSDNVEYVTQQLTKIRFWDNRKWRQFPFYKNKIGIKQVLIDEYTLNTSSNNGDVSFYYSAVQNDGGRLLQMHESNYKQLKQPLSNGNNTLDYINDYIHLYEVLFGKLSDHRIDDNYYEFRDVVIHGENGTLFLKELFEIAMISYVSRFGFYKMFEASLWLYRVIYSLRVSMKRNVREDSVFKFVYDKQFVDNIIEVFTTEELFLFLKKHYYSLDTSYADKNKSKGKHISTLQKYFSGLNAIDYYKNNPREFDKHLLLSISDKIKEKQ